MPDARFIQVPDRLNTGAGLPAALPSKFVVAAARRLGWAALIYAGTYTIAYLAARFFSGRAYSTQTDVIAAVAIGLSLVVYLAVRRRWFEPALLLDLGMIYWVVGAVGIDLALYIGFLNEGIVPVGISWVCVWLVVFPLTVPNTPGKVALAAIVTASAGPLSFMLATLTTGASLPAETSYVQLFLPYYLCAAMGIVTSRIVYQLGQDVERALEMGSYQLVERLAQGGMGEVWRAEHKLLARPAAVKLLRPDELGSSPIGERREAQLVRFEREAQATSALRSPHTIQLYDFGLTGDGSFYYAMELLEGLTLDELVGRFGPMSPARCTFLLRQICASLCEAHAFGLVHRDVKPSNIYVTRMGSSFDFVKVLDFGLVKKSTVFDDDGEDDLQLTLDGSAPGTPDYMAPEVARGSKKIDGRADLYSLGCVAYYALTGLRVFEGDTPMEIVIAQANSDPVPPSTRSGRPVPEPLEQLIMACLQKSPDNRPESATRLAKQLAVLTFDEPWDNHDAERWWTEHKPTEAPAEKQTVATAT